ncbi:MAG: D-tyrosyl-tRNA(Tyr) deacylase [Phycisphaerales bacterium]|nr:D-tyrosyl-tRNA(Tyr) deacylase [Phycisphaerales bacterium]
MRAIVQRVASASVDVEGERIAEIGAGLLIYLGVGQADDATHAEYLAHKIRYLRIFRDDEGKMNRDVVEAGGAAIVLSNFSLFGDARKGRRPAYTAAAAPDRAEALYLDFCERLGATGLAVQRGRFQAMMDVAAVNDGPINLLLDSEKLF